MITEYNTDFLAITETWLTDNDDVTLGDICPQGYSALHTPRTTGQGGGLAFISRSCYRTSIVQDVTYNSFEHMKLKLTIKGEIVNVFVVYRPPPSASNGFTISLFKEEFSIFLESNIMTLGKLIISGDLNIHIDDADNSLACFFIETLQSFGLTQHVQSATHNHGHTLDLFITRNHESVVNVNVYDPLISDHLVMSQLNIEKHLNAKKNNHLQKVKVCGYNVIFE